MRKMHKYLKLEPVMAYQVDKEETVHTLYGEAEANKGDLAKPVSMEDQENLVDWNEDLEGRY